MKFMPFTHFTLAYGQHKCLLFKAVINSGEQAGKFKGNGVLHNEGFAHGGERERGGP
jgi:hypothetical protein